MRRRKSETRRWMCWMIMGTVDGGGRSSDGKANAFGLVFKKATKSPIFRLVRVENSRKKWEHKSRMCSRFSKRYLQYGQDVGSVGKKSFLYSPIGAWASMARVALAHNEFGPVKCGSQPPPLKYEGWTGLLRSPLRRKNRHPGFPGVANDSFHLVRQSLMHLSLSPPMVALGRAPMETSKLETSK